MEIFASVMGASLVILALGSKDSFKWMLDFQFEKVLASDYDIAFRDDVDQGAIDEVKRMAGVYRAEPLLAVPCTLSHGHHRKKVAITGVMPDATMTVPSDADGNAVPLPPAGLLIAQRVADALHVREGDTIRLKPIKGLRQVYDVPVAGIISTTLGLAMYADYHYLNRLVGEAAAVSSVQVKANHTPDQQRQFFRDLKRYPSIQAVTAVGEMKEKMEKEFVASMLAMTVVMIIFAGVIFFGSILNASLIAIAERTREIATLRAIGYTSSEVGATFLRENMLINLIGTAIGMPLGYWLLWSLAMEFTNDIYAMPAIVRPASWVLTVVIAIVFVLLAHIIVQGAIGKIDWARAIKLKE